MPVGLWSGRYGLEEPAFMMVDGVRDYVCAASV